MTQSLYSIIIRTKTWIFFMKSFSFTQKHEQDNDSKKTSCLMTHLLSNNQMWGDQLIYSKMTLTEMNYRTEILIRESKKQSMCKKVISIE
jgi:hypothetical protein